MVRSGRLASLILWGPPGCGKTTIARLLAAETELAFEPLSAVFSGVADLRKVFRSEEHTSELQSLMRISYAVFCLIKKKQHDRHINKEALIYPSSILVKTFIN